MKSNKWSCRSTVILSIALCWLVIFGVTGVSQESSVFVLDGMGGELLLGQKTYDSWGENWSAPTVSTINLGYLAKNGYPLFVPDGNGDGTVDRSDLAAVSDVLGGSKYMDTSVESGTPGPRLLAGLAKYVNENYPNRFEIKVFKDGFKQEYLSVMGGSLPEKLFNVPVRLKPSPTFDSYSHELETGEMVWLGLPQQGSPNNHYLAGRSFDSRGEESEMFLIDYVDPREDRFRKGWAKIGQSPMTSGGEVEYGDSFVKSDIMLSLSPLDVESLVGEKVEGEQEGEETCLPDLTCTVTCDTELNRVCDRWGAGGNCTRVCVEQGPCREWCYDRDQNRYCCKRECAEYETDCRGGDGCVAWKTVPSSTCRVVTENVGCASSGLSIGVFGSSALRMYARQFLNTDMAPGEQQVFIFEVGEEVSVLGATNFCVVDVSDDLEESNEENNEDEESPEEEPLQLRPRKMEGKDVLRMGDIREED